MNILITNDDSIHAQGIKTLERTLKPFGNVYMVAPSVPQSGMSTAVNLGSKHIDVVKHSDNLIEVDASPATCVKYAVNMVPAQFDVVVSGINHGSNAATAALYSGTLGAAIEGTLYGIPSIAVSLNDLSKDADFSYVEKHFPAIFQKFLDWSKTAPKGVYWNVNFPVGEPKGYKFGHMGMGHWVREFEIVDGKLIILGTFMDDTPQEDRLADHHIMQDGYIAITPNSIDLTNYEVLHNCR